MVTLKGRSRVHPTDAHVGKKLKDRRTLLRLSQDQLGNHVNLTFQQIQKYEKGVNRVSSSKLWEFSQILKVPVEYFFMGLDYSVEKSGNEGVMHDVAIGEYSMIQQTISDTTAVLDDLTKSFLKIKSDEVRKQIVNLVQSLSKKN